MRVIKAYQHYQYSETFTNRNKILDDGFLISSINKPFYASCNFSSMSSPRQSLAVKMQGYCLFTTSFISNLRRIYFYIRSFLTYNGKAEKKDHRNYWRKSRIHNFVSLLLALCYVSNFIFIGAANA